jgi:hypothetical protein
MSTDNKNGGFTRRSMLAGAGALAAATFLPAASATADSDNPFMPEPPTAERPYYYIKYDETTKAVNPDARPDHLVTNLERGGEAGKVNFGKNVVLHYGTEGDQYSDYQKALIIDAIKQLNEYTTVPFLLVDVVAYNKNGQDVYATQAYGLITANNHLGVDGEKIDIELGVDRVLPYSKIAVPKDPSDSESQLVHAYDFSLLNFDGDNITTNEQLKKNVGIIFDGIKILVSKQNQALASLGSDVSSVQTPSLEKD